MTTDSGGYYSYFLTSKGPYFFLKAFSPEVHISYNILESWVIYFIVFQDFGIRDHIS